VGIVLAALAAWGGWTLANLPAFKMKSLAITGLEHVSRADVIARAKLDPSANVWFFDRSAIARRIEALAYVRTARLHVRPPADVWLEITERRPDACVLDAAGRRYTIDDASRVLETGCAGSPALTYVLRSDLAVAPATFLHVPELASLQRDVLALGAGGARFGTFSHDRFGQLQATMHDGIAVRFGDDDDLDRKQRLIGPILAQLGPRASDVRTVDLRAPTTPVVEYRH
jgi:cell division septal protein FtsQ